MARIEGLHHLGLTVSDVEISARWYEDVLGFTRSGEFQSSDGVRRKVFLLHPGLGLRLGLVEHAGSSKQPFDETVNGLDHLAFKVPGRVELEQWVERLTRANVHFSPIADSLTIPGAAVIVLRDPDNIQLELFADPG
jgi:glyoxylase I family protein